MIVDGIELMEVDVTKLPDRSPVYIKFDGDKELSQWGVVNAERHQTLHKDYTIMFNKQLKYYSFIDQINQETNNEGVIVNFRGR